MSTLELLIGTHIENPAALSPRPPLMKRMCARCELVLGWVICVPENDGTVTHGECAACHAIIMEELEAWMKSRPRFDISRPTTRA